MNLFIEKHTVPFLMEAIENFMLDFSEFPEPCDQLREVYEQLKESME
jgi:hypothetical protein